MADVATTVIALVPTVAPVCAVSFNELVPAPATDDGVNAAVTPDGNPVTVKLSDPANPPVTDVVIGTSTLLPRATDAVTDVADTLNPLTISVTTAGAGVTPPPVPVMVMG